MAEASEGELRLQRSVALRLELDLIATDDRAAWRTAASMCPSDATCGIRAGLGVRLEGEVGLEGGERKVGLR